jgi:hypothetical protein
MKKNLGKFLGSYSPHGVKSSAKSRETPLTISAFPQEMPKKYPDNPCGLGAIC